MLHDFCRVKVAFGGSKFKHDIYCDSLPNLLKLIKFGVILQNDELHKIFDYFLWAVISFEHEHLPQQTEQDASFLTTNNKAL